MSLGTSKKLKTENDKKESGNSQPSMLSSTQDELNDDFRDKIRKQ